MEKNDVNSTDTKRMWVKIKYILQEKSLEMNS